MNANTLRKSAWLGSAALALALLGTAAQAQDAPNAPTTGTTTIPVVHSQSDFFAAPGDTRTLPQASVSDDGGVPADGGYRIYRVPVARYDAGMVAHLLCRTGIAIVPPNYVLSDGQNAAGRNAGASGGVNPFGVGSNANLPGQGTVGSPVGAFPNSANTGVGLPSVSLPPGAQTIYNNAPYSNAPYGNTAYNTSGAYSSGNGPQAIPGQPASGTSTGAAAQETLPEGVRTIYAHEGNNSLVIEATPDGYKHLMERFHALAF